MGQQGPLPEIIVELNEVTHAMLDPAPTQGKHCQMGAAILW